MDHKATATLKAQINFSTEEPILFDFYHYNLKANF